MFRVKLHEYYMQFIGNKRKRTKVNEELLEWFREIEERSEERELALEEKRIQFEIEMEDRRKRKSKTTE